MKNRRVQIICIVAFSVIMNIVGGEIALLLRLPIYLDCLGTFLIAAVYGPIWGMLPSFLSGILLGLTNDIYALYYAPVGILLGFLTGLFWKKGQQKGGNFLLALLITLPTSLLSACITAYLFHGITSSGSSVLVLLLSKTPLGLTLSCFIVQLLSDYLDRIIELYLVKFLLHKLPHLNLSHSQ